MNKILKTGTLLFALVVIYPSISLAEEVKPTSSVLQPNAVVREGDFKTLKEYEAFKAAQGAVKKMGVPEIRNDKKEIRTDIRNIKNATNTQDRRGAVVDLREDVGELRADRLEMMKNIEERMRLGENERIEKMGLEREELKKRMEDRREEFKNKFEESKNNLKDRLKAKFGDRASEKSENISKSIENALANFTKHIEKLNEVSSKIESEINILSQAGKDVVSLSSMLADAKVDISEAESALTEFQSAYTKMTSSTDPKSEFNTVKSSGKKVAEAIRAAHKELMDLIPQIRSLRGESQATSTTQTTNN